MAPAGLWICSYGMWTVVVLASTAEAALEIAKQAYADAGEDERDASGLFPNLQREWVADPVDGPAAVIGW